MHLFSKKLTQQSPVTRSQGWWLTTPSFQMTYVACNLDLDFPLPHVTINLKEYPGTSLTILPDVFILPPTIYLLLSVPRQHGQYFPVVCLIVWTKACVHWEQAQTGQPWTVLYRGGSVIHCEDELTSKRNIWVGLVVWNISGLPSTLQLGLSYHMWYIATVHITQYTCKLVCMYACIHVCMYAFKHVFMYSTKNSYKKI